MEYQHGSPTITRETEMRSLAQLHHLNFKNLFSQRSGGGGLGKEKEDFIAHRGKAGKKGASRFPI